MSEKETVIQQKISFTEEELQNLIADVMAHGSLDITSNEANSDVSSIGPTWPPQATSFERTKAIFAENIIKDKEQLLTLLRTVLNAKKEHGTSRASMRVFIDKSTLHKVADEIADYGEVIFALEGTIPGLEDAYLLYLGENREDRHSNKVELQKCMRHLESSLQRNESSYSVITQRVLEKGFTLRLLSYEERTTDENIQTQLAALYAKFQWTYEAVIEMISNESSSIIIAEKDGQIVSAVLGEKSFLEVEGMPLVMAEITEAATHEDFQGNGLYTAVAAELIKALYDSGVSLAFGECNGLAPGVLNASKTLCRTFGYELILKKGLPFKGYLPQHVTIDGVERTTKYNDLFPSYITKRKMKEFLEK